MGTYTLSAIVTKVTGQTVLEFLKPRLFEPLGIENPQWGASPEGNSLGGYGLKLCTEDIAKFGQLYLQKGKWNGKQLIPQPMGRAGHQQAGAQRQGIHAKMAATGTKATASSSGDARTTPSAATEPTASSAS